MRSNRPRLYDFGSEDPQRPRIRVKRLGPGPHERLAAPHGHRFLELLYFAEAAGRHRVGRTRWDTAPGDVVFVSPGEIHAWGDPRLGRSTPGEIHAWDSDVQDRGGHAWVLQFTADAICPHEESWACVFAFTTSPLLRPFLRSGSEPTVRTRVPEAERPAWETGTRSTRPRAEHLSAAPAGARLLSLDEASSAP